MIGRCTLLAIAAGVAVPAMGCAPPPPETRTEAQIQADVRRQFDAARDLIELRMVQTATDRHDGAAVVTRSFKGRVRPGTRLRIHTMDYAACGYGIAKRGLSYRMYLSGMPTTFFQPLQPDVAAILVQIGVLTPSWR